jgi:peptide/nickel transport system substrate-binding protein
LSAFQLPFINRRDVLRGTLALGLASATGVPARAATPKRGGKFVVGVKGGSSTDSLDPVFMLAPVQGFVSYQIGNRLVERSPEGELIGELAQDWSPVEGGKAWVFNLRKDVTFHNGKPLTAQDMAYSINRHMGPGSTSGAAGQLERIDRISVEGEHQLTVHLKDVDVGLPYLMANYQLFAIPEGVEPDAGVGTGPYVLDVAEAGKRYTFHRNPNYFKQDRAWFDEVEILVINDETARISALLATSVNAITHVPARLASRLSSTPQVNLATSDSSTYNYFAMRCDVAPFDNKDLRLALKYAVDREAMVKQLLGGYGELGNDSPINSVYPLFSDDLPAFSYNIEKAREHYAKSGHSGTIELKASDAAFPGAIDAAQFFQASAKEAGIDIQVIREPADGYWENVWLKAPFCASYWGANSTEDQALSIAYQTGAPWNDTAFSNAEFDQLLSDGRRELDPSKRKEIYRRAVEIVQGDGGHIIMMFPQSIAAVQKNIAGLRIDNFGAWGKVTEQSWFEDV